MLKTSVGDVSAIKLRFTGRIALMWGFGAWERPNRLIQNSGASPSKALHRVERIRDDAAVNKFRLRTELIDHGNAGQLRQLFQRSQFRSGTGPPWRRR